MGRRSMSRHSLDLTLSTDAQIELIDFGATRAYTTEFIDRFHGLLLAAVAEDEDECLRLSRDLGYLTGEENQVRTGSAGLLCAID